MSRVAVLDDYQGVARSFGPWDALGSDADIVFFSEHIAGDDELVERLAGFDVVVAMRERTPFGAARLARLPDLRLTRACARAAGSAPSARNLLGARSE